ncbi:nickel ABC transporter, nickel/metallophore periplasmic binding protein [Verticiella sediminum]|uniref:Nickel ABC transporter, nickel/metallophore periplasmic binding protein n=1 Tax=Verticiella sediminum TaxID=1247510 RepID=A0A556B1G8_9BURK|nr:nickel ABC transporter substrate-binding protein [Verticiella sediminum]TSH99036.1 nickel ABC transporter, nickel/metallophore periplasmic binding protein [Verticiella sediminum]
MFRHCLRSFLAACVVVMAGVHPALAQTLTIAWPQNVGTVNPHLYSPEQMFAQAMVYEGLVRLGDDGRIEPALASAWTMSEDGRRYRFTLREGVRFSNGDPFDAQAVADNVRAILENRARHEWLALIEQIERVEAIDARTVEFVFKSAYYPVLQELALVRPMRFMAPSAFGADGGTRNGIRAPIGTGPWKHVETRLGEYDVFERNDGYWGKPAGYQRVVVKVIPDPTSRAIALQTGEVDLVYGMGGLLAPDAFEQFRRMPGYTATLSPPYEGLSLALNTAHGPTRELAVRRAINHAVDKDTLVASVLHGSQRRADFLFNRNVPYADSVSLTSYAYAPARAEALLEAAGWLRPRPGAVREKDGARLTVELLYTGTDGVMKSLAEVLQADLAKAGIGVALRAEEAGSVQARMRDGRFGMVFNRTWGAPYDPHAYVGSMRSPSHADYQAQRGLPEKAALDADITRVLSTVDEAERRTLYARILRTLHEEAVYLPLTEVGAIAVARAALGEIPFAPMSSELPLARMQPPSGEARR